MATMPLFNGTVYAFAQDGDTVYAGGTFTSVNGVTGYNGLAKFNASTGVVDTSWRPSAGNTVRALVISPDKTFVIMGGTSSTGGNFLRKYLVNSNSLQSFVTVSDQVTALVMDGNYLYVSRFGAFASSTATSVQGTFVRPRVVKIDVTGNSGQGSIDATFVSTTNVGGGGEPGQGVMAQDANYLYIGGNFDKWNNATQNRIVKINKTNAATASDWAGGTGFNNTVQGLTVGSNGSIYAVGIFSTYKGVSTSGQIVKLDATGTRDTGFTSSVIVTNGLWSISEYNSALYVGTQYNTAEAATSTGVLKSTNLTTFTKDSAFLSGTGFGTTGVSGRAFIVGNNVFLTSSASTAYKGSAAGFNWTIDKSTAAITSMVSNSAIPASFSLTSFSANQSVTATILKDSVSGQAKVQAHPTLSNSSTWRWIVLVYTKSTGGKHYEGFDARMGSPTGKIKTTLAGGTTLTFSHLFIVNSGRQSVKILAADIPNASSLNLSVTA